MVMKYISGHTYGIGYSQRGESTDKTMAARDNDVLEYFYVERKNVDGKVTGTVTCTMRATTTK